MTYPLLLMAETTNHIVTAQKKAHSQISSYYYDDHQKQWQSHSGIVQFKWYF